MTQKEPASWLWLREGESLVLKLIGFLATKEPSQATEMCKMRMVKALLSDESHVGLGQDGKVSLRCPVGSAECKPH